MPTDQQIADIFKAFDTSGDGYIDAAELKAALEKGGKRVSGDDCSYLLSKVDKNNDSKIDLKEFTAVFHLADDDIPAVLQPLVDVGGLFMAGLSGIGRLADFVGKSASMLWGAPHPNCPPELRVFKEAFNFWHKGDKGQKSKRVKIWKAWDANANGYLSLAECDSNIKAHLIGHCKSVAKGEAIWRRFRPSYIKAFNDAKDASPDRQSQDGDYITSPELRLFVLYLDLYATMFEVFALVDGCSEGTTALDDRRIDREEWKASLDKVRKVGREWAPFVALKEASEEDFGEVDANGGGMILLGEWVKWIEAKEKATGTWIGAQLAIGE